MTTIRDIKADTTETGPLLPTEVEINDLGCVVAHWYDGTEEPYNSLDDLSEALQVSTLQIGKYADPVEPERFGLTVEEAAEVARQDAGLLYLDVEGR